MVWVHYIEGLDSGSISIPAITSSDPARTLANRAPPKGLGYADPDLISLPAIPGFWHLAAKKY